MIPAFLRGYAPNGAPYEPDGGWAAYASHLHGYMRRWILRTPWGTLRLHNILRADDDADPHDHPFDFWSLVVRGGYIEERYTRRATWRMGIGWKSNGARVDIEPRGFGSLAHRNAMDMHRIGYVKANTWTIVITGPKRRPWGFLTEHGWVGWRAYVNGQRRPTPAAPSTG